MPSFRFEEMILLSHSERRARRIKFHPKATIIRGPNDTGKSSLIKSLFLTFGAVPTNVHPRWKAAKVTTLVRFNVDQARYTIYRHGNSYSLFSANNEHLGTYTSITNELAPALGEIFQFRLSLLDHKGVARIPPPAYLFLPFYIDQDHGWSRNWSSFERLKQFKNFRKDVVYYHTGVRPNEWYVLNAQAKALEARRQEPLERERVLLNVMRRFEAELANADFDFDLMSYKKEINRLLRRCEELKQAEEQYKEKLVELETERIRLTAQKEIVLYARKELEADYLYAHHLHEDSVDCPLCGTNFSNDIGERFAIAQDEDRCVGLLQEIEERLGDLDDRISRHQATLTENGNETKRINSILSEKKGRVTLKSIIEAQGKREMSSTLKSDLDVTQGVIGDLDAQLRQVQEGIGQLEDKRLKEAIVNGYRDRMRQHCDFLNVRELADYAYAHMDAEIKESGSDLPRALLAYFLSIAGTVKQYGYYSSFPLVIDAPNQQEQDQDNLKRMLQAIRDERPDGSQLIMGLVDDLGIDFEGSTIELTETNYSLRLEEYEELADEVRMYAEMNLTT
ncbi:MAG TPA: hypothetical protein PKD12_03330 [Nitrospira sp.]|nr:hypothetical protein [Nitrospira sp.]